MKPFRKECRIWTSISAAINLLAFCTRISTFMVPKNVRSSKVWAQATVGTRAPDTKGSADPASVWTFHRLRLRVKALANEDTLLRTHCCPRCFLGCANWETFVADTKCFWIKSETLLCPGHKICVRNKCCARGQTGKHLCRQQCFRLNVSSFARALRIKSWRLVVTCSFRLVLPASTLSWSKAVDVEDNELMEAIEIVS